MGQQTKPATKADREQDWSEELLDMDDELDIDLDGSDFDDEEIVDTVGIAQAPWRLIEQLREQRMLQDSLEDFDQYVI